MDEIILQPEDTSESGETRNSETEALDEATFEPQAHVERTGDYKQSEAIQAAFESLTANAVENNKVTATSLPIPKTEENDTSSNERQTVETVKRTVEQIAEKKPQTKGKDG